MEIERKFLVRELPSDLEQYPHSKITQGYLCREPVVRVRQDGDTFTLTYKGSGLLSREEYNLPLTEDAFSHLIQKADGRIIEKTRYRIPYEAYTIELDLFEGDLAPLILAEVEFESIEKARAFSGPDWFSQDVTEDPSYHNSNMV